MFGEGISYHATRIQKLSDTHGYQEGNTCALADMSSPEDGDEKSFVLNQVEPIGFTTQDREKEHFYGIEK